MAITADIQQQVFDLLARASNVSFVTAEQESSVTLLSPGQRVVAEVLAQLPNNRIQVQVGTERFNLDLPMTTRIGQTLEMTFVAAEPRSTFAVARRAAIAPPVSLSDASRLLSMLIANEQKVDQQFRSSLQSISELMRRSSGEAAVLANLLDEALIYGEREASLTSALTGATKGLVAEPDVKSSSAAQARLATFETNASQLLKNIAHNSRFTLIEASSHPVAPLPLLPGEEINATVVGILPGGRFLVQIAGTTVELPLPQKIQPGEIIRLTYISADPKPAFALARTVSDSSPPLLSEAGRWLSVLEHSKGGVSRQQTYILERLNTVLKSLPPDSPAFTAISEETITYRRGGLPAADTSAASVTAAAGQSPAFSGNGIVLTDDMAKLLQAVIKGNRLALLETLNQQAQSAAFTPGQQLKGEVLAALGGGRFSVQVAGQIFEFLLPKGIRRGDLINLFYITDEPQQTFLMARFGRSGDAKVSDTGRWLSGFLGEVTGQLPAQSTMGILRTLLIEPTTDAQLLGRVLQQGLRDSGLFYESHLARWFGGGYSLEELLKEPQGQLSPRLLTTEKHGMVSTEALARASVRTGSTEIMEAVFQKAGSSMAHEGIADQRTLTIISEQLTALQNSRLLFSGDLFPGQQLQWSVAEREAGRSPSGKRERSWETSVTVSLPNLGGVTARLSLDGNHVAIRISATDDQSVLILEKGKLQLTEQLEGAGLTPSELSISHAA